MWFFNFKCGHQFTRALDLLSQFWLVVLGLNAIVLGDGIFQLSSEQPSFLEVVMVNSPTGSIFVCVSVIYLHVSPDRSMLSFQGTNIPTTSSTISFNAITNFV